MPSDPNLLASAVPRIGVAVFIVHPSPTPSDPSGWKFLVGQRLGSHGSGTWALPGGHLEMGESFEDCAAREVLEETGLVVEHVAFLTVTNDVLPQREGGKHYATIFMTARVEADANGLAPARPEESECGTGRGNVGTGTSGSEKDLEMPEARIMESEKCTGWEWVQWGQLETWVAAQIEREKGSVSADEGDDDARPLFSPMVNLLVQRPGIVPRLS